MNTKSFPAIFLLLIFPFLVSAQYKKKKTPIHWGVQSGVHVSFLNIEDSPVEKEPFLGLSFGVVAQKKLFDSHFSWAKWRRKLAIYLETGLIGMRDGYQYSLDNKAIYHNEFSFKMPFVFVLKGNMSPIYRRLDKKGLKAVGRYGVDLSFRRSKEINKSYTNSDGTLKIQESSIQNTKIRVPFYGGVGLEKQHIDGGHSFCGISVHISGKPTISGEIVVEQDGQQKSGFISKHIFYYSIDVQYFFGKNKRFGKGVPPAVIFNPRFL